MIASISKLAELSGLDRRTVSAKLTDIPSRPGPKGAKLYEVATAMRVLFGSTATNGVELLDPAQEKALLDRARRMGVETQNAVAAGNLLDASVVAETWAAQVSIAKGRLLALPARIAPAVVGLGDLRAIENVIRAEVFEALTELATDPDQPGD